MLPAYRPASGREHARQAGYLIRPHPQFGYADGQAGRMLDADILDVDACLARRHEQPGELARPVRYHHLHRSEGPSRPAVLAGDAMHSVDPALQKIGDPLDCLLVTGCQALA